MNPFPGALHYFRIFREYAGRRIYLVLALAIVAGIADGFGIALLLPLLKVMEVGGEPTGRMATALFGVVEWLGLGDSVPGLLLLIGALFIAKGAFQFGSNAYGGLLRAQLFHQMKVRLFDAYGGMDYLYYVKGSTGHFINVLNSQVNQFFISFTSYVTFLTRILLAAFYLFAVLTISWQFGLMALIFGGMLLFMLRALNERVRVLSRQTSSEIGKLNKLLVQFLQSFKYLSATNQMVNFRGGIVRSMDRLTKQSIHGSMISAVTQATVEPICVVFILIILTFQVAVLKQPIAPVFVAIVLFYRSLTTILGIHIQWQNTLSGSGSVEMIRDELRALDQNQASGGARPLSPLSSGIELRGVDFAYSSDQSTVLNNLTLTIPARATVAFVGESGAGKSTLADLLALLLRPQRGAILIDGVDSREVDVASWRSQIGYVSQDTVVFNDTIAANISLMIEETGTDPATLPSIRAAAARASLADFIDTLPDGYETIVGERGMTLSGGQRQRLFIARELYKRPSLLVLDEATSALDSEVERDVQASIDALHGEVTVVMIAHRLSTIRKADRVYVLEGGKVVEQGSYSELREREGSRFRKMVSLQVI